ncbi:phosphopantetheine-binding protein [Nocardia brasiliensis]|uniref:phosphopantetheine-binding protein n=1 Tax=Nocardia brasiliensis TaxID=37326 RepID=UPI00366D5829
MISKADFIRIVRDELALPLADKDLDEDLDQVVNWSSMLMVRLVVALEQETGQKVQISDLLTERTLQGIYARAVGA